MCHSVYSKEIVEEMSALEPQPNTLRSPVTHASNFNFSCDSPDRLSLLHLKKHFDYESAYDFLSPTALQPSTLPEDHDPKHFLKNVLDESFFCDTSSGILLEPQFDAAAASIAAEELEFREVLVKQQLMPYYDSLVKVFGVRSWAQLRALDHIELERHFALNGMPSHHRKRLIGLCSISDVPSIHGAKIIHAKPLKRKFKKDAILEALRIDTLSEADVFVKFGDSQSIRHLLRELLRGGLVNRVGQGGRKDPFRYYAKQSAP
jgi:hypothetical protein